MVIPSIFLWAEASRLGLYARPLEAGILRPLNQRPINCDLPRRSRRPRLPRASWQASPKTGCTNRWELTIIRKWIGSMRLEFSAMLDLSKMRQHSTEAIPMVDSLSVRNAWHLPLCQNLLAKTHAQPGRELGIGSAQSRHGR